MAAHSLHVTRSCPACGSSRADRPRRVAGYTFLRCRSCRSLYRAEAPEARDLSALYAAEYHDRRGHLDDAAIERAKVETASSYLAAIAAAVPASCRYLEIGCSAGAALSAAVALGWQCWGVELSHAAAAVAARRPGVRAVYGGALEEAPLQPQSFDVVALFDVLEHLEDPPASLRRIRDLLVAGGVLLLVTPDGDSLSARWLGARWPHLLPEHLLCFSRPALRRALTGAGFEVQRMAFAWKKVNLQMIAHHARLHESVLGARLLSALPRLLPARVLNAPVPFNLGEVYVLARRAADDADPGRR